MSGDVTLFADFNNAASSGVRLNAHGTIQDLAAQKIELRDGMRVMLDDGEGLRVHGVVRYCLNEGWVAVIDWDTIQHYGPGL